MASTDAGQSQKRPGIGSTLQSRAKQTSSYFIWDLGNQCSSKFGSRHGTFPHSLGLRAQKELRGMGNGCQHKQAYPCREAVGRISWLTLANGSQIVAP